MAVIHNFIKTAEYDDRIIQGQTKLDTTFVFQGADITDWIPYGEVRTNYKYLQGELLAEFTFPPITFEVTTGINYITPMLFWRQTEELPMHEVSRGRPIPGVNVWVYDIDILDPITDVKVRLVQGFFELNPMVVTRLIEA